MKKRFFLLCLLSFFVFFVKDVFAKDYSVKEYIPITDSSSIDTDLFHYRDMNFTLHLNDRLALITFRSIENHTDKKIPISINLLLFDKNKKNIGYLTYCSEKDFESDYANFKIGARETHVFAINLTNMYFAKDKSQDDLSYVVVYDDNPYCQIGGYARYEGKTLEEIIKQVNSHDKTFSNRFYELLQSFFKSSFANIIIYIVIGIILLSITGNVINKLYYRFYHVNTNMAYLPFLNYYICVKLSFGGIIGLGYLVLLLISLVLWYFKISFLLVLTNLIGILSFIIVIFKLITKKYDFLFFEPSLDKDDDSSLKNENNHFFQNSNIGEKFSEEKIVDQFSKKMDEDELEEKILDEKLEREDKKEAEKEARREKKREMKLAKKIAKERERERKKQEKLAKKKLNTSSTLEGNVKNADSSPSSIIYNHNNESSSVPLSPLDDLDLKYNEDDFKDSIDLSLDDDDDSNDL